MKKNIAKRASVRYEGNEIDNSLDGFAYRIAAVSAIAAKTTIGKNDKNGPRRKFDMYY